MPPRPGRCCAASASGCRAPPGWRIGRNGGRRNGWNARRWRISPDIIAAELVPGPEGAGLFLYSRSLFGWSDFGVNRRRVAAWIAALDTALRRP
ncbi:DUF1499 domain-containing protein [Siccirubricoccus sp. G192]|uniref:DUF1499 domain-containing protein n=1 Tax=Siccirubricoccus sp. G192 TaxID=2849651 RepID=UPI001C2B8602|nr:DUF1499 domain-containing protein [Siccirubricoccus sp. G192]MBV1798180.1 DUF1499 domain-containing protein [Siccirubricoccus sp. G192]